MALRVPLPDVRATVMCQVQKPRSISRSLDIHHARVIKVELDALLAMAVVGAFEMGVSML